MLERCSYAVVKSQLMQTESRDALSHACRAVYTKVDVRCVKQATVVGRLLTLTTLAAGRGHGEIFQSPQIRKGSTVRKK